MNVVFDLDGTLADNSHREHFLQGEKKDWDAFFEASDGDLPIWPAINTLVALDSTLDRARWKNRIEIWSGRGSGANGSVRRKTIRWLNKHITVTLHIRPDPHPEFFYTDAAVDLRMRDHTDYTQDQDLKKRWLDEARAQGNPPDLVFDDRQKVVDMWRAEGIPCFQVAPGDF